MDIGKKDFIGDLLVKRQLITTEQLQAALAEQRKTGKKLVIFSLRIDLLMSVVS